MSIYFFGFSISVLLLYLATHVKQGWRQRRIVCVIALIIPCLIAAFRADKIGTDTSVYLVQITNEALQANDFREYLNASWWYSWRYKSVSDYEIAFTVVVYITAKIFNNIGAVKFVIEALMVFSIYFALKKLGREKELWLAYLVYYCMMFNSSLNIMRQFIAMAFVFFAFACAANREKKKAILYEIIALLFHTSALLGFVIYGLFIFVNKDIPIRGFRILKKYSRMICAIAIGVFLILGVSVVVRIMSLVGLSRYIEYISGDVQFLPNQIISRLPVIIAFLVLWKKLKISEPWYRFFLIMMAYDLICSQFASVMSYAGRISWYFSQFEMLSIPAFCKCTKRYKLILGLLVSYLMFYWWFYYVNLNWGETVPYVFY